MIEMWKRKGENAFEEEEEKLLNNNAYRVNVAPEGKEADWEAGKAESDQENGEHKIKLQESAAYVEPKEEEWGEGHLRSGKISIDDFLIKSGGFGRFQFYLFLISCSVSAFVVSWQTFSMVFINQVPDVVCYSNGTHSPFPSENAKWSPTTSEQWDLVCDNRWQLTLVDSLFFVGWFFGDGFFGWLADRYGRRPAFWSAILITNIFAGLCALIPWFWLYVALRFLTGLGAGGAATVNFVIGIEFIPVHLRSIVGSMYNACFALGVLTLIPLAYFTNSWRLLCILSIIPGILLFLAYRFVQESPRYFLVLAKPDRAAGILLHVAKVNNMPVGELNPSDLETFSTKDSKEEAGNVKDLFLKELRVRVMAMLYMWVTASLVYYGLSLNVGNLNTDLYVTTAISASVEFPGCLAGAWLIQKFGRKIGLFVTIFLAGICCGSFVFLGTDSTVGLALSMVGKCGISGSFAIVYLYGCEIIPTSLRGLALGVFSQGGRVGSILAPFIVLIGEDNETLPYLIFSILALLASVCVWFLPETLNNPLQEVTERGRKK